MLDRAATISTLETHIQRNEAELLRFKAMLADVNLNVVASAKLKLKRLETTIQQIKKELGDFVNGKSNILGKVYACENGYTFHAKAKIDGLIYGHIFNDNGDEDRLAYYSLSGQYATIPSLLDVDFTKPIAILDSHERISV